MKAITYASFEAIVHKMKEGAGQTRLQMQPFNCYRCVERDVIGRDFYGSKFIEHSIVISIAVLQVFFSFQRNIIHQLYVCTCEAMRSMILHVEGYEVYCHKILVS